MSILDTHLLASTNLNSHTLSPLETQQPANTDHYSHTSLHREPTPTHDHGPRRDPLEIFVKNEKTQTWHSYTTRWGPSQESMPNSGQAAQPAIPDSAPVTLPTGPGKRSAPREYSGQRAPKRAKTDMAVSHPPAVSLPAMLLPLSHLDSSVSKDSLTTVSLNLSPKENPLEGASLFPTPPSDDVPFWNRDHVRRGLEGTLANSGAPLPWGYTDNSLWRTNCLATHHDEQLSERKNPERWSESEEGAWEPRWWARNEDQGDLFSVPSASDPVNFPRARKGLNACAVPSIPGPTGSALASLVYPSPSASSSSTSRPTTRPPLPLGKTKGTKTTKATKRMAAPMYTERMTRSRTKTSPETQMTNRSHSQRTTKTKTKKTTTNKAKATANSDESGYQPSETEIFSDFDDKESDQEEVEVVDGFNPYRWRSGGAKWKGPRWF